MEGVEGNGSYIQKTRQKTYFVCQQPDIIEQKTYILTNNMPTETRKQDT